MNPLDLFLTLYIWNLAVISCIITFIICIICYPFVEQKTFSRIYESIPGYIIMYAMIIPGFWDLKIVDRRKDKSWNERYIVVANHLSFVDSLIMAVSIPIKKKYMMAEKFFKIPIFGWMTKSSGNISVNRRDKNSTSTSVEKAIKTIEVDNCSFGIYCEGKRETIPYVMETFKTGAFRIAYKTKLPILPVTLLGTSEAMSYGGIASRAKILVIIDEPFNVENEDYSFYANKTKNIIQKNLE